MDDKALLKVEKDVESRLKLGKWKLYDGQLHLKLEHWSNWAHSKPEFLRCNGGWIRIKNLALSYWKSSVFATIGQQLGGLKSISSQTNSRPCPYCK